MYRGWIRRTFNSFRSADIHHFKKRFINGKFCNIFVSYFCIISILVTFISCTLINIVAYIQVQHEIEAGEKTDDPLMKLIQISNDNGGKIGEYLLDYKNVDKKIFKTFLDIAMPAVSKTSFIQTAMLGEKLSDITTVSEEAFAIIVLENCMNRWVFLAEHPNYMESHTTSGDTERVVGNVNVNSDVSSQDDDNNQQLPQLKYQHKIKARKDGRVSAGEWNTRGLMRYNEISNMVKIARSEENRIGDFEDDIVTMYEEDTDIETVRRMLHKRRRQQKDDSVGESPNKIVVVNFFDVGTIESL